MYRRFLRLLLPLLAVIMTSLSANAQYKKNIEYSGFFDSYYFRGPWSFTIGTGPTLYSGDLSGFFDSPKIGWNGNIGMNYHMWPRVVFGGQFDYFTLRGVDTNEERGLSFTSNNWSLSAYGRFYLVEDIVRKHLDLFKRPKLLKPYIGTGLMLVRSNASPVIDSTGAPLTTSDDPNEDPSVKAFSLALPVNLGLSVDISHRVSIIGELSGVYTLTDKLDGVTSENAEGNSAKDGYAMFTLKLEYTPGAPRLKRKKHKLTPPPVGEGGPPAKPEVEEKEEEAPTESLPQENTLPMEEETPQDDSMEDNGSDDGWDDAPQEEEPAEEEAPADDEGDWNDDWDDGDW